MSTPFCSVPNNVQTTLGAAYVAGSGTVRLANGFGAILAARIASNGFNPVSSTAPLRFTLIAASAINAFNQITNTSKVAIYQATGLTGDVLSGVTVVQGTTDQAFAAGDTFDVFWTAGDAQALQAALQNVQDRLTAAEGNITTNMAAIATNTAAIAGIVGGTTATNAGALLGNLLSATAPGDQYVLTWIAATSRWTAQALPPILAPNGNGSGLTGLTFGQVSGTVPVNQGGTGQITAAAGFNALSPLTTLGDVLYGGASGAGTRLAGNATTTRKFLRQTGTGSASAAPAWDTVTQADVGLSAVENTALSTWGGSTNLITLGTVTAGTWHGAVIGTAYGGAGTANGMLKADGAGNVSAATAGTDYVFPGGVSLGQTVKGGTGASENLTLVSTNHATKGKVILAVSTTYVDASGNLTQTSGQMFFPDGSVANPGLASAGQPSLGFLRMTGTDLALVYASSTYLQMGAGGLRVDAGSMIGWSNTAQNAAAGYDTAIKRTAAAKIKLTNGSTGTADLTLGALSLGTFTDALAPANSLFLSSDHLDGNGEPKLCRKGATAVTVIG